MLHSISYAFLSYFPTHNFYTVVVNVCSLLELLLNLGGFMEWSVPRMIEELAVMHHKEVSESKTYTMPRG